MRKTKEDKDAEDLFRELLESKKYISINEAIKKHKKKWEKKKN